MESYMALSMQIEEDDAKSDVEEEAVMNADAEQELISEINEQSQKIQTLEIEVKDAVFKNAEYVAEIEELKALLKKREKQMTQLSKDVDRLQDDNETLLKSGGGGLVLLEAMG